MCRNDRAGAHTDVQHDRPQRVIRVADPQRDVALTGERETIRLELIVEYFLIDHDTVSYASKSPPADLILEAARLFLELTKRLPLPKKRPPVVTTAARSEALPDIATVVEFVPDYEASVWAGIGAPKATPAEIVEKLNREINAGLADPRMKARLADLGGIVLPGSPSDFGKLIAD